MHQLLPMQYLISNSNNQISYQQFDQLAQEKKTQFMQTIDSLEEISSDLENQIQRNLRERIFDKVNAKKPSILNFLKEFQRKIENFETELNSNHKDSFEIEKNLKENLQNFNVQLFDLINEDQNFSGLFQKFSQVNQNFVQKENQNCAKKCLNVILDQETKENYQTKSKKIKQIIDEQYPINDSIQIMKINEIQEEIKVLLSKVEQLEKSKEKLKDQSDLYSKGMSQIFQDFLQKMNSFMKDNQERQVTSDEIESVDIESKIECLKKNQKNEIFCKYENFLISDKQVLQFYQTNYERQIFQVLIKIFQNQNLKDSLITQVVQHDQIFCEQYSDLRTESNRLFELLGFKEYKELIQNRHVIIPVQITENHIIIIRIVHSEKTLIEIYNPHKSQFLHLNNIYYFLIRNLMSQYFESVLSYDKFISHEKSFAYKYKDNYQIELQDYQEPMFVSLSVLLSVLKNQEIKIENGFFKMTKNSMMSILFKLRSTGNDKFIFQIIFQ